MLVEVLKNDSTTVEGNGSVKRAARDAIASTTFALQQQKQQQQQRHNAVRRRTDEQQRILAYHPTDE